MWPLSNYRSVPSLVDFRHIVHDLYTNMFKNDKNEFFRHNFVKNENFDIPKRRALAKDNSARYDTRIIEIRLAVFEF